MAETGLTTTLNPANSAGANPLAPLTRYFTQFNQMPPKNRMALLIGIPLLIAGLVSLLLWSKQPDYKVLFSNVNDTDGGAIVAALTQMNVPYQYSEGGSAILVPSDKVHDTRLRLASQGLPKGSIVGFELLENQKLGITQFQEQVNYQRALEGELTRSIMALGAVRGARVHLAIPKQSVFMREQQRPTASVVLTLNGGRMLDRSQIQGIVHLVSSSVPEMSPKGVSIVDQTGALLTQQENNGQMDATQLAYANTVESNYTKRVLDILTPLFGIDNVRATVTADLDFSQTESTEETYKPNGDPKEAAVRSQQISESNNGTTSGPQGVPGTLSNQPPAGGVANIGANPQSGVNGANAPAANNSNTRKDSTVNYEVDKQVKYTKAQIGLVKRVSAAVVVNNKTITDAKGVSKSVALSPQEIDQINALVKEAIGFKEDRGDTVNVVNQVFNKVEEKPIPVWQQPEVMDLAKAIGFPLGAALVAAILVFGLFKPLLKSQPNAGQKDQLLNAQQPLLSTTVGGDDIELLKQIANEPGSGLPINDPRQQRMEELRKLAKENPQLVASIIKNWVTGE